MVDLLVAKPLLYDAFNVDGDMKRRTLCHVHVTTCECDVCPSAVTSHTHTHTHTHTA